MFGKPLFSGHHLITYLDERMRAARKAVEAIPAPALLASFVDELAGELTARFAIDIVVVLRESVSETATDIVIPRDAVLTGRLWFSGDDADPPREVAGQLIRFHVPYLGNADLLSLRGTQIALVPPRAELLPGSLVFSYPTATPADLAAARRRFELALEQTCRLAAEHAAAVEDFDLRLEPTLRHLIQARRARLAAAFAQPQA